MLPADGVVLQPARPAGEAPKVTSAPRRVKRFPTIDPPSLASTAPRQTGQIGLILVH